MDELDCAWLPDWAVGETTGICIGAQLPTKDGRRTGNAVVTGRKHHTWLTSTTYGGVRSWTVLTDAGNSLVLSDEEIKELFYDPKWVMNVASCPGNQRQQGADQELEACREWLADAGNHGFGYDCAQIMSANLLAARRPKPQFPPPQIIREDFSVMSTQHPITPPPELVRDWARLKITNEGPEALWRRIATLAARWGADQELDGCVEWLAIQLNCTDQEHIVPYLRGCRRPKPQTLSSIALQMLGTIERDGHYLPEITDTIRKAIEALPND